MAAEDFIFPEEMTPAELEEYYRTGMLPRRSSRQPTTAATGPTATALPPGQQGMLGPSDGPGAGAPRRPGATGEITTPDTKEGEKQRRLNAANERYANGEISHWDLLNQQNEINRLFAEEEAEAGIFQGIDGVHELHRQAYLEYLSMNPQAAMAEQQYQDQKVASGGQRTWTPDGDPNSGGETGQPGPDPQQPAETPEEKFSREQRELRERTRYDYED